MYQDVIESGPSGVVEYVGFCCIELLSFVDHPVPVRYLIVLGLSRSRLHNLYYDSRGYERLLMWKVVQLP